MKKANPAAFLSYVHRDDKYQQVSTLRERLSDEIGMQTGAEFPIFQDRKDIEWGQNWRQRLEESLDAVTFLIPVITPGFFNSEYCREELRRFLEREKQLNRSDLILPIYFVDTPLLNDEELRAGDELAEAIASRQWADWRELRFESFSNPLVGKTLARLARQIRDALPRVKPATKAAGPRPASSETQPAAHLAGEGGGRRSQSSPAKNEPPTLVVDQMHRGDATTITEAVEKAEPGTRILVRPGFYRESLVIDKPLEIVGQGEPGEVVVEASDKSVLLFRTTMGRVSNLTLRQAGGKRTYAVNIAQGRLELEDCDISSEALACVAVNNGADPIMRRNRVHDGADVGVCFFRNGRGTLEDSDIFGNALAGVEIKEGGNPTLRRNRIHDGKQAGVSIYGNGEGTLEDNDIYGNAFAGVEIREGGNPILRRNRIHDGKQIGVVFHDNARGTLEENEIFGNAFFAVRIQTDSDPILRRNRIRDGKSGGVIVRENGRGTLEDNDICGNEYAGVETTSGGAPTVRRNRINKNGYEAIWVHKGGAGTFEDNDLRQNTGGPWDIEADCEPNVKRENNQED